MTKPEHKIGRTKKRDARQKKGGKRWKFSGSSFFFTMQNTIKVLQIPRSVHILQHSTRIFSSGIIPIQNKQFSTPNRVDSVRTEVWVKIKQRKQELEKKAQELYDYVQKNEEKLAPQNLRKKPLSNTQRNKPPQIKEQKDNSVPLFCFVY